jgi:toxin ParE1/3/4
MRKWRLSLRAEEDIRSIWRTIAADNPKAADGVFNRIMDHIERAAEHPGIGAPRPEIGDNVRILVESPYIVIYLPNDSGILVTAIVHGARDRASWV